MSYTFQCSGALSTKDVMSILNTSKYSVYRLINAGELKSVKVGHKLLISERSLEKYLARSEKYYTVQEYAKLIGKSECMVHYLIRTHQVKSKRIRGRRLIKKPADQVG